MSEASFQRDANQRAWQTLEPIVERWLDMDRPEIDPALLARDWQAELPFLDWQPDGTLRLDMDDRGRRCVPIREGAKLPRSVSKLVTTATMVVSGKRVNRKLLPCDAPPLRDYQRFVDYKGDKWIYENFTEPANVLHESIADSDNPEPIPRKLLRADPGLVAWLIGENPNRAMTMAEYKVLKPAFIERLRRLKERAIGGSQPRIIRLPFVPNIFQCAILAALDGKSLMKQPLADAVCGGEGSRLYRAGGLKELTEAGKVCHKTRLGYYRPDAPPPSP